MTAKEWSREIAAVTPFVRGTTVQLDGAIDTEVPGVTQHVAATVSGLASLADSSVDTLVCIGGLELLQDSVAALRSFRRVVREGGALLLVVRTPEAPEPVAAAEVRYSASALANLCVLVGGFRVTRLEEVVPGETILFAAERSAIAEVRQPFGVHGADIVRQVTANEAARSEYYFQIGTLMLQTGDPQLATTCFEKVLLSEPDNAEAHFGLGMTYGTQNRWQEALDQLEIAALHDPGNPGVQRWVELARQSLLGTPQVGIPHTAPAPAQATASAATSAGLRV